MDRPDFGAPAAGEGAGAGARVMREVIRTPAFLEIIKTNMAAVDPEKAGAAVRTVLWEDPELALSLMGTGPEVVNYLVEAVLELGRQMNQFPGPLLDAFALQMAGRLDSEKLAAVPGVWRPVMEKTDLASRAKAMMARAINAGARAVNDTARSNPYFLRDSLAGIDGREVALAVFAVVKSACLWGFSAAARLIRTVTGGAMRGDVS